MIIKIKFTGEKPPIQSEVEPTPNRTVQLLGDDISRCIGRRIKAGNSIHLDDDEILVELISTVILTHGVLGDSSVD